MKLDLERKRLKIRRSETEYRKNEFGGWGHVVDDIRRLIIINGDNVGKFEIFK